MSLLPVFLKLDGRRGLLVGAGAVALEKIGSLLPTGVRLRVIAPEACAEIRQLAAEGRLVWVQKPFAPADLDGNNTDDNDLSGNHSDGNFVVIAATNSPAVNAEVYREAVARGILVNSVDDPPHCDFYFGSVVRRGELQIAISTAGESPAVAQQLRREIDAQLPADLGSWLENLGQLRREVLATQPAGEARKALLHALAQRQICAAPSCPARALARAPLSALDAHTAPDQSPAKVYLIGAGPGDPELLTVKALRLLESAAVILHDDLVPPAILALASPTAEVVNVGKRNGAKSITQEEINARLIECARAESEAGNQPGRPIVRLKSGDPLLFSRAAEEMAALIGAGIPFEIVPGISAAFAAAAALGCSLTSRNSASSVLFSTGHHAASDRNRPAPIEESTRVVYMPGRDLHALAGQWLAEGLPAELPCAVVSQAGQSGQQLQLATLAALGDAPPVAAPSLLIAGWALRESAAVLRKPVPAQRGDQETTSQK